MSSGSPAPGSYMSESGSPIGRIHIITGTACLENIVVSNDTGSCGAFVNYTVPTADGATVIQIDDSGLTSGDEFPVGITVQQYEFDFGGGKLDTCTFNVTVNDTEPPVMDCPENIVVSNDPGECGAIVSFSTRVDEGLYGELLIDEVPPGSLSEWQVMDSGGNPAFSYMEIESPYDGSTAIKTSVLGTTTSRCPSQLIEKTYDISGNTDSTKLKAYLEFTSTMDTYNFPYLVVSLFDNEDIRVGYQIYYGKGVISGIYAGYAASDPESFTELSESSGDMVLDLSKMGIDISFSTIKITLANYACVGENSIVFDHLRVINSSIDDGSGSMDPVASDNCSGTVVEASIPSDSFFQIGTTPVTLTATDAAGNTTSCSFTVTVEDTEPPVAVCGSGSAGTNVLLLWDEDNANTRSLKTAIETAGFTVTLPAVPEYQWDGTNPSLDGFDAVIHLNGTTYNYGLPMSAQNALLDFVQVQGKLFIHSEWDAYAIDATVSQPALAPIVILQRIEGYEKAITYNAVPGYETHPVLEGIPASFNIDFAGHNVGQVRHYDSYPAENLMLDQDGNAAVAIRELEKGRVVGFGHAGNYADSNSLSNANVQQLFINALKWGAHSTGEFKFELDETGTVILTPEDIDGGSADNCGIASMELSKTEFTWGDIGSQEVTLTVTDIHGNSSTCTGTVSIEGSPNLPPVIVAATEVYVWEGDSVTLDASETWDPNGDRLNFTWTQYNSAFRDKVILINPNDPQVSFFAPEVDELTGMPIRLKVSDGTENSVLIIWVYVKPNNIPLANAGTDVVLYEGEAGVLDGTASSDADDDSLTYRWTSDYLTLDDVTSPTPAFVAPEVDTDTTVWITLVVNDGKADSEPDSVQVTVKRVNRRPVADAGANITVNEGEQIAFDGSASYDPDGDPLSYAWSAVGFTITDPDLVAASLTAPEVEEDTTVPVVLVVNDGELNSEPDTVWVSILHVNKMPVWVEVPVDTVMAGNEFSANIKVSDPDMLDVLSIYSDDLPEWLVITDYGDGTATISADSVPDLESLLGTHTFLLKASDGTVSIDTLMELTITIGTGITDWQLSMLRIYPNPTSGIVNLDFDHLPAMGTLLQVFNQLGQTIAIRQIDQQNSVIDLSEHPAGMYYLKVNSNGKIQTEKIILR